MSIFRDPGAPVEAVAPPAEAATDDVFGPATTEGTTEAGQAPDSEVQKEATTEEGHPDTAPTTEDPLAGYRDPKTGMLLGRFKTADDLVKGYQELRRQLSREGTNKTQELVDTVMGKPPATEPQAQPQQQVQQQPQQQQVSPEQFRQQVQKAMEQDPAGTIMRLAQMAAAQMMQQQVAPLYQRVQASEMKAVMSEMALTYPDFPKLAPNISQLLQTRPHLRQLVLQNPAAIEDVYRMAKADLGSQAITAAREAGAQDAVETLRNKVGATGLPGAKASKQQSQQVSDEQAIVDQIFAPTKGKGIFDPV